MDGYPDHSEGKHIATIPEIEARIHDLWTKGDARSLDEALELGRLLGVLQTEMPPGDFYKHVLDVLHIPARAAKRFIQEYREYQEAEGYPWLDAHDAHKKGDI